jgi:hypothetical protein
MENKLILMNQLAMMRWMLMTGMAAPDVRPALREQVKATQEQIELWDAALAKPPEH